MKKLTKNEREIKMNKKNFKIQIEKDLNKRIERELSELPYPECLRLETVEVRFSEETIELSLNNYGSWIRTDNNKWRKRCCNKEVYGTIPNSFEELPVKGEKIELGGCPHCKWGTMEVL